MSPLNYSSRGAPVNLGVYDFPVKMDFLGVLDDSYFLQFAAYTFYEKHFY